MRRSLVIITKRSVTTSQCRHQVSSDWSSNQYLKFEDERTIPVKDLLGKVPLQSPSKIIDLGCGPGNSTAVLAERYPNATLIGMDSSPDMLKKAKNTLPDLEFVQADLTTYRPPPETDLLFSNAVFQWLKYDSRLATMQRLLKALKPGGVLAIQMPNVYRQESHSTMRHVASEGREWQQLMAEEQPGLDELPSTQNIYDVLIPLCDTVNLWQTSYTHVLRDHEAIVEWVKGTGLRPYLDLLDTKHQNLFISRYLEQLKKYYPVAADGRVLLYYQRLFIVALRGSQT